MQLHYRGSKYVNFIWHSSLVVLKDQASKLFATSFRLLFVMAYKRFGLGGQIIPFWKREIESLPKWQKGDPQIRIFLPTFWMKMIKPPEDTPSNQVYFVTHPQRLHHAGSHCMTGTALQFLTCPTIFSGQYRAMLSLRVWLVSYNAI
ncbi:hypothetical protein EB796_000682 [Bugula neritina]|uniref:Uncharacterized protein n=1 Tax=Bugula neritina TaxID=10212 RepID=A0A7J7KS88_BUGNE|nr:hypothetical protein EB796_000682 [Bugula neritina]